nr:hypothetical protein [Arenicellales bacterium]
AGVPVHVSVAPVIPALTDHDMESILRECVKAGATFASYTLLRLPWEVKDIFKQWLEEHYPERANHVMSLVRQSRGGKEYDSNFTQRKSGTGPFAELLAKRFKLACVRHGLNTSSVALATNRFRSPQPQQAFSF